MNLLKCCMIVTRSNYVMLAKLLIVANNVVHHCLILAMRMLENNVDNSCEICQRCAKILLAAEHKIQLAYYLRNTDWFQRCSEFGFFDEPVIILFTIFY